MQRIISVELTYVCAFLIGENSLTDLKLQFLEILKCAEQSEIGKIIIDGRKLEVALSVIDIFMFGVFIAEEVLKIKWPGTSLPKIAFVYGPLLFDSQKFEDTVAHNRGADVKTFNNMADAANWLGLKI